MKYDKPGTYQVTLVATDECGNTTEVERTIVVEGDVKITGANNVTINQGVGINLTDGVSATGVMGQNIPYTVDPESIEKCAVGAHEITYTATDQGITETAKRTVTIEQIADPVISGISDLTVNVGEEFDPLDGVSAKDGNGNTVAVTVEAPDEPVTVFIGKPNCLGGTGAGYAFIEEEFADNSIKAKNGDSYKLTIENLRIGEAELGTIIREGTVSNEVILRFEGTGIQIDIWLARETGAEYGIWLEQEGDYNTESLCVGKTTLQLIKEG